MRCGSCGQDLSEGAGTCPRCGQLVLAVRPAAPEAMPGVVASDTPPPHMAVGRLGLFAEGNGRKRRLPRATVVAIAERMAGGAGP